MPSPKELWFRYMRFSRSGKSGTKRSSTTYEPWTIYEAQQDMCYSSKDNLIKSNS
jgi:hypothetical protein